eukprot:14393747-Alexandrium_andersonii.AAC.1
MAVSRRLRCPPPLSQRTPGGRSLRRKARGGRGEVDHVRQHREAEHLAQLRRLADGLRHVVWPRA